MSESFTRQPETHVNNVSDRPPAFPHHEAGPARGSAWTAWTGGGRAGAGDGIVRFIAANIRPWAAISTPHPRPILPDWLPSGQLRKGAGGMM